MSNNQNNFTTRFRQRLAWIGRMPWPYRMLFGTQALVVIFAFNYRLSLIEQGKRQLEMEQGQGSDIIKRRTTTSTSQRTDS